MTIPLTKMAVLSVTDAVPTRDKSVWVPLITPLTSSGTVDPAATERLVERVLPHVDGVMALGTTGERATLGRYEACRLLDTVSAVLDQRLPLLVGIGGPDRATAIQNGEDAIRFGANAVALSAPYYYPITQSALSVHVSAVAETLPVALFLYDIPQYTHNPFSTETVLALAYRHPNIAGIKDSSGDLARLRVLLRELPAGRAVLQGASERLALSSWVLGITGYVSGLENLVPGAQRALLAAVAANDWARAQEIQDRLDSILAAIERGFWLSNLKKAMGAIGIGSGATTYPLVDSENDNSASTSEILSVASL